MAIFQLVLALLIGGVGLALLAPRLRVPWPALLALAGTTLAFIPGVPAVALDPELALALFVAPVLLDAAYDASPRDLRDNWWAVGSLVLIAVGLTVAGIAVLARALVPDMPWSAAVALGAIVAPPDAAAATSVLRSVRLPHRLLVILEGESLLNDASTLLIYRLAVAAAATGVTIWSAPLLALAAVGGVAFGIAAARLFLWLTTRMRAGPEATLMQFLGTFAVWIAADALGLSAILTVVAYAITAARTAPSRTGARARRYSYAVWEVVVFVLNMLAFILVGLQLRGILQRLDRPADYLSFAAAVLAATIAIRIAWVMSYNTFLRWKNRRFGARTPRPMLLPSWQGGVVIAWCGMRGIVTLAAALALPERFPQRDLIVFAAFGVVLGTLVLQGMTLRPLLGRLTLPHDDSVDEEEALARSECARAALAALGPERATTKAAYVLAQEYEARLAEATSQPRGGSGLTALRRRALAAERSCAIAMRREGRIGDDAFHRIEEDLDWAQAAVEDGRATPAS